MGDVVGVSPVKLFEDGQTYRGQLRYHRGRLVHSVSPFMMATLILGLGPYCYGLQVYYWPPRLDKGPICLCVRALTKGHFALVHAYTISSAGCDLAGPLWSGLRCGGNRTLLT